MHEVGMFVILFACLSLSAPVVWILIATVAIWETWWARAAHVTVSLAITAALAFGIYEGIQAVSLGDCANRHAGQVCVEEPLD